jgi:hypothetical protein
MVDNIQITKAFRIIDQNKDAKITQAELKEASTKKRELQIAEDSFSYIDKSFYKLSNEINSIRGSF